MRMTIILILLGGWIGGVEADMQTIWIAPAPIGSESEASLNIEAGQAVRFVSASQNEYSVCDVRAGTNMFSFSSSTLRSSSGSHMHELVFTGPVDLVFRHSANYDPVAWTVEITPSSYSPDKSAVVTERDGPMKCTLEESTDLVNWTQSTSGQTHTLTNANAKKFFRIKLEQDVGP